VTSFYSSWIFMCLVGFGLVAAAILVIRKARSHTASQPLPSQSYNTFNL
jgi:bacteriorhodopsin